MLIHPPPHGGLPLLLRVLLEVFRRPSPLQCWCRGGLLRGYMLIHPLSSSVEGLPLLLRIHWSYYVRIRLVGGKVRLALPPKAQVLGRPKYVHATRWRRFV